MEILLRSSWQVVNIGDIAHTPGILAVLEKYIPEAAVTVWASGDITPEVLEMQHRRFPNVKFVKGSADDPEIRDAIRRTDFFLHGSGPFLSGAKGLQAFVQASDKPYGVFGITYRDDPLENELLNGAEFVYFRDGKSLENAAGNGIHAKFMAFGPDAAFATDVEDEEKAQLFLARNGLRDKEFVCCIPRLRYTPYWEIRSTPYDAERDRYNQELKEHDHVYLRRAITDVVRRTGRKVLICPEDMTQIKVGREVLYDRLPEDVRENVVLRDTFWLPDEAVSVYKRAVCLFGNEMHSPIMCIGHDIPAIVCRWKEQTTKGYMWQDIGLAEWLFDSDEGIDEEAFSDTVLGIVEHPDEAVRKAHKANEYVQSLLAGGMGRVRTLLGLSPALQK